MILKLLHVENFLLIEKADVTFQSGLTLVEGENRDALGASSNFTGKSSLVEAIVYCLYGKTIRDITAAEVVNNKTKKGCIVHLIFEHADKEYKLTRTRGYGKFGNTTVKIEVDGQDVTPANKPQDLIDTVVGLDFQAFCHVCVFAQNNDFRFIKLPNARQKEIIETIIGFDRFHAYLDRVKERFDIIGEKYHDEKKTLIESNERVRIYKQELEQLEEKKISKKEEQEREAALKKLRATEEKLRLRFKKFRREEEEIDEALLEIRSAKRALESELEKEKKSGMKAKKLLTGGECPVCRQEISEDVVGLLLSKAARKIMFLKRELSRKKTALEPVTQTKKEMVGKIGTLLGKLRKIEAEKAQETAPSVDQVYYKERKEYATNEVADAKQTAFYSKQQMIKLDNIAEHYAFLEKAWSRDGIESLLLDQLLPFLNERANYYASELSGGRVYVHFATVKQTMKGDLRDVFHVQVKASEGGESYGACSGSEERWADLAVALAKRDLAEATGRGVPPVLLLDEVCDTIDEVGSARALTFLSEYAKDRTVWLISHNASLKQHFDNSITVIREGGVSHV